MRGWMRIFLGLLILEASGQAQEGQGLAQKAREILTVHCHRCHGEGGAIEGGLNHVLDRDRLVTDRRIVPGQPDESPLFRRVASGKMPPPGTEKRPSPEQITLLRAWIAQGAPRDTKKERVIAPREEDIPGLIRNDLERLERRQRRFIRYLSLAEVARAGQSTDDLQTYRQALVKLLNSLSFHPRLAVLHPVDPAKLLLRFDLRDLLWDASVWNRLLVDYPYGLVAEGNAARSVLLDTGTRLPWLRGDWFLATASRAPLYYDLLRLPRALPELEGQLRVDATANIRQDRVARAGFHGSGVARNNRLIERHDAAHGAYWRTYDFEAVAQNLGDRGSLLPDRRNLFAFPLGPFSFADRGRVAANEVFLHAGGEVIFHLPNGLQGYMLVDGQGQRVDRAPVALVSDPRRPDRAVEAGLSCIGCHYRGLNPKEDQIRDHVTANPTAFSRADAARIRALHPPIAQMTALMEEDMARFRLALEKTGNRISSYEPISLLTLRYEEDLDARTAAAEVGVTVESLLGCLSDGRGGRTLGALRSQGGRVARPVFVQEFADLIRLLGRARPLDPTRLADTTQEGTGEVDPLESLGNAATALVILPGRGTAMVASTDRTVRLRDIATGRELRRGIGHTASVWSLALSADGQRLLSGAADGTLRLWDTSTLREQRIFEGHEGVVLSLTFSPNGRQALSAGSDDCLFLWDLETGKILRRWEERYRRVQEVHFSLDGTHAYVAAGETVYVLDLAKTQPDRLLEGHKGGITAMALADQGRTLIVGSADGAVRLWEARELRPSSTLKGVNKSVTALLASEDGQRIHSGHADGSIRVWDRTSAKVVHRLSARVGSGAVRTLALQGGTLIRGTEDGIFTVLDRK